MNTRTLVMLCAAALGLGACAAIPPAGPSVMVLPGAGATFDQFRMDQAVCEQFASAAIGRATPSQEAQNAAMNSTATGAAVGAAAGAAIGAASGDAGQGAAIGAGLGMLGGALAGADAYSRSAEVMQDRYDTAYVQCMYSKGHQVPVPSGYQITPQQQSPRPYVAPPPPAGVMPPGYTPPPPPR